MWIIYGHINFNKKTKHNAKARTFYMGMMRMYNQGNIDQYPASLL